MKLTAIPIAALLTAALLLCGACSARRAAAGGDSATEAPAAATAPLFDADSAYAYVERLTAFGPRVPNTEAHRQAGDWLAATLRAHGWIVTEQTATLTAFDGTPLRARNILGQLNPEKADRLLLLAHWDCRPWADQDPDPARRHEPVPGANDGASGVGVLLEMARQLGTHPADLPGIDILFVDAEDWGTDNDEESWALGTRHFVNNPPLPGYRPAQAILLDMVGSPDARFGWEYFSQEANPALLRRIWSAAASLGHGKHFTTEFGGAVTDDHVELIKAGIPAVDIIDYRYSPSYQGFDPTWHTTADDMSNISPQTLRAVGETLMKIIEN